jgi:ribulose-phosphate 3-epimerase
VGRRRHHPPHGGFEPVAVLGDDLDLDPLAREPAGGEHQPTVRSVPDHRTTGGHPVQIDPKRLARSGIGGSTGVVWHHDEPMGTNQPDPPPAPGPVTRLPIRIVPSVLPADFAQLGEECRRLESAGADRLQFDVMDGRFVPNLTFGPDVIAAVRDTVSVPFEAHLMIEQPDALLDRFVEAGCGIVIIHAEACAHLHRALSAIAELGASPAVALNPHTPIDVVENVLDLIEMVLVMTVNPGFGGQAYLRSMETKITAARALLDTADHPIDLEVDGGIGLGTAAGAARAGANVLVAGSALFRHPGGLAAAVAELRQTAAG